MVNSRSLLDLSEPAYLKCKLHMAACKARGVNILVTSTYRDYEAQEALYAIGRTVELNRKPVTKARAGKSWHNFKCAWDVVPLDFENKPIWDTKHPHWKIIHEVARGLDIECGADWKSFPDFPHLQVLPGKMTLAQAKIVFDEKGTLFT